MTSLPTGEWKLRKRLLQPRPNRRFQPLATDCRPYDEAFFFLGQAMHWILKRNFIYLFLTRKQNKYFWNMSCTSVKLKPESNWHSISTALSLRAKFKATCHRSRMLLSDWSGVCESSFPGDCSDFSQASRLPLLLSALSQKSLATLFSAHMSPGGKVILLHWKLFEIMCLFSRFKTSIHILLVDLLYSVSMERDMRNPGRFSSSLFPDRSFCVYVKAAILSQDTQQGS